MHTAQAYESNTPATKPRKKSWLDNYYSRPLTAAEVLTADKLTPALLLELYMTEGKSSESDKYWYFRPWRGSTGTPPKESRVYVRQQLNGYTGFAYFDANAQIWLMTQSSIEVALAQATAYHKEPSLLTRELSYQSNHQSVWWSAVDVATIDDIVFENGGIPLDTDQDSPALRLALIRWMLDPQRKRRNFGG